MPAHPLLRAASLLALVLLAACQSSPPSAPPASASAAPIAPAAAGDAFVLLSGGGTPASNNYSQYLQARAVTAFLQARYPRDSVWIFFGVGNRDGQPPLLADVYRQTKDTGKNLLLDTWLPGSLPDNRPATKENVLRTLRTEILPRVRSGGTLYLFVGDHGALTAGKNPESNITLWGLRRDTAQARGWSPARDDSLTVTDLRNALAAGLGSGRVVFVMTQCHSGGFHELGVPREVSPPSAWFSSAPAWLAPTPKRLPLAAGFTATDEASIAAGCDPAPDPDTWFGYERFLPEKLLGHDLLSPGSAGSPPASSFAAAHHAATLADHTIDKPRSTSDHYLERWANLIETKLAHELLLTPPVRTALEHYRAAVDTHRFPSAPHLADPAFRETHARFTEFTERMIAQNPATRRLLLAGTRAELEKPSVPRGPRAPRNDDDTSVGNLSRTQSQLWREVLRPAWHNAVNTRSVPDLAPAILAFEKGLQPHESRRPAGFADDWSSRALNELYWSSTYASPARFDPVTARTLTEWAATRRTVILAWADRSTDSAVRDAAAKFGPEFRRPRTAPAPTRNTTIAATTAAARALYYRRVLAAWAFLLELDHRPALTQLAALRTLEQTPLPISNLKSEILPLKSET